MQGQAPSPRLHRGVRRHLQRTGFRPRAAASIIVLLWAVGVVVFGVVECLVDPSTFDNVWIAMWWALQTVTTVGYGDIVPETGAGRRQRLPDRHEVRKSWLRESLSKPAVRTPGLDVWSTVR